MEKAPYNNINANKNILLHNINVNENNSIVALMLIEI
jgi:hypothetical protein